MPSIETHRHLILAGTNKSGTTAVFRYLGDHPDVAVSRQKEARFFYKVAKADAIEPSKLREEYEAQFLTGSTGSDTLFVEASPQYLHGGQAIASRIKTILPDANLMFILRNPTERVVSYFRSSHGQPHVPTFGLSSEEFVKTAVSATTMDSSEIDKLSKRRRAFRQELRVCHYAEFLPAFIDEFGPDNVLVTFFDQLSASPYELMVEICEFSGIDSSVYQDYTFRVENRTRNHRNLTLRHIAGRLNSQLEPMLNRFPAVRRGARHLYDLVNVDNSRSVEFTSIARDELDKYFEPWNASLRTLMVKTYPGKELPDWLSSS